MQRVIHVIAVSEALVGENFQKCIYFFAVSLWLENSLNAEDYILRAAVL